MRPRCETCGLDYAFIDTGNRPAIFIIMGAGAIVVAAALIVEARRAKQVPRRKKPRSRCSSNLAFSLF